MEAAAAQLSLQPGGPRIGEVDVALVLVRVDVQALLQRLDQRQQAPQTEVDGLVAARQHQWRARLVNQQGVRFIHQHGVEPPQHPLGGGRDQLIAEEVEADLLGAGVSDVGPVGLPPRSGGQVVGDPGGAQPEQAVDRRHPARVALGQVVVEGPDVHALARGHEEHHGGHGGERLALAGLHLDHPPLGQRHTSDDLLVEQAHAEQPPTGLTHRGEERIGACDTRAVVGAGAELRQAAPRLHLELGL